MVAVGMEVAEGQVIATVGDKSVNGGWEPHLHFQLSWEEPEGNDMPGVVARSDSCLLYTSPSPRDVEESRMPSSA